MRAFLFSLLIAGSALPASAAILNPDRNPFPHPAPSEACKALAQKTVRPDAPPPFRRLDKLPWAMPFLAVLRSVDGCPVAEVRYRGQNVYLIPKEPGPSAATPLEKRLQ